MDDLVAAAGDKRPKSDKSVVASWSSWGVKPQTRNNESFSVKCRRRNYDRAERRRRLVGGSERGN